MQITSALKYTREGAESSHSWPYTLPGGKEILYTVAHGTEDKSIVVYSLETDEKWDILQPGSDARYINTGHLIYTWKGDLLAVPFNMGKKRIEGDPVVICKGVKSLVVKTMIA